jgi:hypothetical protein
LIVAAVVRSQSPATRPRRQHRRCAARAPCHRNAARQESGRPNRAHHATAGTPRL